MLNSCRNFIFLMLGIFILSGCSIFSPVKIACPSTYVLNDIPCVAPQPSTNQLTLIVPLPESNSVCNTTQMAYSCYPYHIAYFAKNCWADTPARMFQPLMIQTLQNTRYFHAVLARAVSSDGYILQIHLLDLKQQFTPCGSFIVFKLRAEIISSTNHVIATKEMCIVEPVLCNTPYGGVIAANKATCIALKELTKFCLSMLGK